MHRRWCTTGHAMPHCPIYNICYKNSTVTRCGCVYCADRQYVSNSKSLQQVMTNRRQLIINCNEISELQIYPMINRKFYIQSKAARIKRNRELSWRLVEIKWFIDWRLALRGLYCTIAGVAFSLNLSSRLQKKCPDIYLHNGKTKGSARLRWQIYVSFSPSTQRLRMKFTTTVSLILKLQKQSAKVPEFLQ